MTRRPTGFTLVEVLVAFVVLELGLLGAVGLLLAASQALARAALLERAAGEAWAVADSLSRSGPGGSGQVERGEWRVVWGPGENGSLQVSAFARETAAAGERDPVAVLVLP